MSEFTADRIELGTALGYALGYVLRDVKAAQSVKVYGKNPVASSKILADNRVLLSPGTPQALELIRAMTDAVRQRRSLSWEDHIRAIQMKWAACIEAEHIAVRLP